MREPADPRVHDFELLAEIQLYADVMIAASESPGPLAAGRLDRALGLPLALPTALLHR
jgi:hypothetical protein